MPHLSRCAVPAGVASFSAELKADRQVGSAETGSALSVANMKKSVSVSSDCSLPPPLEDDVDSVCSDELLGSQSRCWLADLMTGDMPAESGDVNTLGRDGLFVDRHFPVGELEMQSGVKWKRPKVKTK